MEWEFNFFRGDFAGVLDDVFAYATRRSRLLIVS